jgi:hypothetical protein
MPRHARCSVPNAAMRRAWLAHDTAARIGALSRFRRFLVPIQQLTQDQLDFLTRLDHISPEALVALDARHRRWHRVARYLRDPGDHRAGWFAVVIDTAQGHGLGQAMVEQLAAHADANSTRTLHGIASAGNRRPGSWAG